MISADSSPQFFRNRFVQFLTSFFTSSLLVILISFVLFSIAGSAELKLAWDPNTESDLAGYKIYYGTIEGGPYNSPGSPRIIVGNITNCTLNNLTPGQTYYVVAAAYDTSNNESGYSNEVSGAVTDPAQNIIVTTNPSGLQIMVDGSAYVAPHAFNWATGSTHTISVGSPQEGAAGIRYGYSSWSDGGGQAHTITAPPSSATYAASFRTEYRLVTAASPSDVGTVSPSGINWYSSGQMVSILATVSPGYSFSNWSGDLSATANPVSMTMNGPKGITAHFSSIAEIVSAPVAPKGPASGTSGTSYSYTTGGSSSNIGHGVEYQFDWKGDGTELSPWGSQTQSKSWAGAGTFSVRARARCLTHTSVVSSWSPALSVAMSQATLSQTVTTDPLGLQIMVDGTAYVAPHAFNWGAGSTHTLSVGSPQEGSAGIRYVFSSWSNGGAQTHTITAPSSGATYAASFRTEYRLVTAASPSDVGTVSPSGINWYSSGQMVSILATVSPGYSFSNWSGDFSGTANPVSLTMNGPKGVTAHFSQGQSSLAVNIDPLDSGAVTKNPEKATYAKGDKVTLTAVPKQGYGFAGWSGSANGTTNPIILTMDGNKTVTAKFSSTSGALSVVPTEGLSVSGKQGGPFNSSSKVYTLQNSGGSAINWSMSKTQNWLNLSNNSGSLAPGESTTVTVSLNPNANGLGAGSYSDTLTLKNTSNQIGNTVRSADLIVSPPAEQSFTITTNPVGLQVKVDGSIYAAPQLFSWAPGSSHNLQVSSPQFGISGVRYSFVSWSDGGGMIHDIIAPSSDTTYTADFMTQYSLTTSVDPPGAGAVFPSGVGWYVSGLSVSVSAVAEQGYTFSNWSGDLSGSDSITMILMDGPKNVAAYFLAENTVPDKGIGKPKAPNGPSKGITGNTYKYATGGFASDSGNSVEYQFDWTGDGTDLSAWGPAAQSKTWTHASIHYIRARARISDDPNVVSDWSEAIAVTVLEKPFIQVTSPQGNETYLVGTTHSISWISGYLTPTATIYLFYSYDKAWHQIAALPADATSYEWTVPDIPTELGVVAPNSGARKTSIWIGSWAESGWECWKTSPGFRIMEHGWVFTVSGNDKGGGTIRLGETTLGGYGISWARGMFEIEGTYILHPDGTMDGAYSMYDIYDQSVVLEQGNFSGMVNSLTTKMTLRLNTADGESLFNMNAVRMVGEPEIPVDWKATISKGVQGTFDLLKIEPCQVGDDVYSHLFKISGAASTPSGLMDMEGYFFVPDAKNKNSYGIYTVTGALSETGVFSGRINPDAASGTFLFNVLSDAGTKYTLTGQPAP